MLLHVQSKFSRDANGGKCSTHAQILSGPAELATCVVGKVDLFLYLTRSAGKNLEACPVSSMLLIFLFIFYNLSTDVEKNLITIHVPSSLFISTASGEREDALPQTPECTNSTGLFKEAAGMDQFTYIVILFCFVRLLIEDWNTFEATLSGFRLLDEATGNQSSESIYKTPHIFMSFLSYHTFIAVSN